LSRGEKFEELQRSKKKEEEGKAVPMVYSETPRDGEMC
jgi:hypothetical protein